MLLFQVYLNKNKTDITITQKLFIIYFFNNVDIFKLNI